MLLSSSQSSTQNLKALTVAVCEISTRELRSNLVVQTQDFRKMLLSSSQSSTQNLNALAVVVREI